ncbi:DUF4224 domain-containing protein [Bordetella petrii]|uniref:DUF4224 domain-containing protein n=1 Tax=Bordetella petrii TaxID=94624 RepID=UPI0004901DEA|nr:DUF4224 domain-containing protein [Bordetella petrii]
MLTLNASEIVEITHRKRTSAQARVLKALGIRFQIRPDGSLLVYRHAVDKGRLDTIPAREPQLRLRNGPSPQI